MFVLIHQKIEKNTHTHKHTRADLCACTHAHKYVAKRDQKTKLYQGKISAYTDTYLYQE